MARKAKRIVGIRGVKKVEWNVEVLSGRKKSGLHPSQILKAGKRDGENVIFYQEYGSKGYVTERVVYTDLKGEVVIEGWRFTLKNDLLTWKRNC